jgi:hypothetical protein
MTKDAYLTLVCLTEDNKINLVYHEDDEERKVKLKITLNRSDAIYMVEHLNEAISKIHD